MSDTNEVSGNEDARQVIVELSRIRIQLALIEDKVSVALRGSDAKPTSTSADHDALFRRIVEDVWRDGNGTINDQDDDFVDQRVTEIIERIKTGRRLS